jgi:hypothetical protein
MAKNSDLFKDERPGLPETQREGIQAILPGLSLSKILHDVGKELKEQAVMGSHELASALFRGDGFVMYPRTNHDNGVDHGLPDMQQEQERGGREM